MMKKRKIELELNEDDEILERDVRQFGTSSHVTLPLKHKGKKAKVIIQNKINKRKDVKVK